MQETQVWSPAWEDPREENGYPLQYSCLENSTERGAWWATVTERLTLLLSRQDQQEYWWKAAGGDFPLGQDGAAAISFTPSADTIDKTDKIYETVVLKTLDVRQQSTAIPEKQKRKMNSMIAPAYCSEMVFISTPNWPEHTWFFSIHRSFIKIVPTLGL